MTNGKAVPSFRPPSAVKPNRRASRSSPWDTWTSEASTGSVGASNAPTSSDTARDPPSATPTAAVSPIVTTMATVASRMGTFQGAWEERTGSFRPTANKDTSTTTSVRISSRWASSWMPMLRSSSSNP